MGLAHFSIGTATDRIDLLRNCRVADWDPSETPIDDTWAGSALAEGRRPVRHRVVNAIESMNLHIIAPTQDKVAEWSQDLRRILILARQYWDTDHQPEIVYVAAKGRCETNMRYCWVYAGSLGRDSDPYGQPFAGPGAPRFWERPFGFERSAWMANLPGVGTAATVTSTQSFCFPSHLEFDGTDDVLDCQSDVAIDDLPDFAIAGKGRVTVEGWIRLSGWGEGGLGRIYDKGFLFFYVSQTQGLGAWIMCAGGNAVAECGLDEFALDGDWHHVLMTYSETGAGLPFGRMIYLAIDGTWVASYTTQSQSIGNYTSDAAINALIGDRVASDRCFDGDIGWVRVSGSIRHSPADGDFTPPERCQLPDLDASVMGQWIKEGTGATVANQAGGTAATLTGATWDCDCPHTYGYAGPPPAPTASSPGTYVGSFTKPVGLGVQTISGLPFRPQILFLWSTGQTATGVVDIDNYASLGMACEDSIGNLYQACMGWSAQDNVNPSVTGSRQSNAAIVGQVNFGGVLANEATIAFISDGFTLNWTTNDGLALEYGYAAFRSANITDCMIRTWLTSGAGGNQAVAGVGFQPDGYIDIGGGLTACPAGRTDYYCGLGAVDPLANSFGSGWAGVSGSGLGGFGTMVQGTGATHFMPNSAPVPGLRNRFNHFSFDANGFTVNHIATNGTPYYHHTLCIEGSQFAVGSFTEPLGGGVRVVGGLPFRPDLVLLFHNGTVGGGVAGGPNNPAFGAADQALRAGVGMSYDDRANPTDCSRWISHAHCISSMTASAAVRGAAVMGSLDPFGFSVNYTTWTGGATHPVYYVAFKVT